MRDFEAPNLPIFNIRVIHKLRWQDFAHFVDISKSIPLQVSGKICIPLSFPVLTTYLTHLVNVVYEHPYLFLTLTDSHQSAVHNWTTFQLSLQHWDVVRSDNHKKLSGRDTTFLQISPLPFKVPRWKSSDLPSLEQFLFFTL